MQEKIPEKFGRFIVKKELGRGAKGVVYLAWDEMIGRFVAIKHLHMFDQDGADKLHLENHPLLREGRIVGKFNHSHIISIFDIGQQDNSYYLVMEYVDGPNIYEMLDRGMDLPLKDKVSIIAMAARALHYAHQHGVLHRDIKPANIIIVNNRYPKIADFGIAKLIDIAAAEKNGDNSISPYDSYAGTPNYMSPEQLRKEELDERSDIFSLGILTYEWIARQRPFQGDTLQQRLEAILEKDPVPLSEIADVDRELEYLVGRTLRKDKNDRFHSADGLSDALELYLHRRKKPVTVTEKISYDKIKIIEKLRKKYEFFADFTNEELIKILAMSRKEKFPEGTEIIQEGTTGSKMYVIISGSVVITKNVRGEQVEVKRLEAGSCVGEMAIIDRQPRSASVVTCEPTVAVEINETVLRLSNPELCLKLYRNLAAIISERFRQHDSKYLDLLVGRGDADQNDS